MTIIIENKTIIIKGKGKLSQKEKNKITPLIKKGYIVYDLRKEL